jgi:hypothetical protein
VRYCFGKKENIVYMQWWQWWQWLSEIEPNLTKPIEVNCRFVNEKLFTGGNMSSAFRTQKDK